VLAKDQPVMLKLVVFVPPTHADSLMAAMASAGAGTIGNYELCSFRLEGTGTFKPAPGAKPFTGAAGRLESVEEVRLEMVLPRWKLEGVVAAMRRAHPYEEAAYDVYDLANSSDAYGSGAIGALETRMPLSKFLARVKRALGVPSLRFTGRPRGGIKRVAVCGGSGSGYLQAAIRRGADAFVTSDCTYHLFQECDGRIALIDAGHFETERPVVPVIVEYLRQQCGRPPAGVRVAASTSMKNIVQYYMS
jgi:hypothetical protein